MSDEPRFHHRRVFYSGSVALPPSQQVPPVAVYFSAAAGGYVCLVPEMETTPRAVVGDAAPVIDRSVLAKLQRYNLEHLEHRMILTAARSVPADAAFVHREGRQTVAAYEIRTRDRRRGRAWSVFFFVDVRRSPRRVVHCIIQPCAPGGGLEMDCSTSERPFRAANECTADHVRDIKHAWGMLISYRSVACEVERPKSEAHDTTSKVLADDREEGGRSGVVCGHDNRLLTCTRIGIGPSVEPSSHLGIARPLDFLTTLRVFDVDLCVEHPLRGFNRLALSQAKALHLLERFSGELLILQALTHAEVWRQYRAASHSVYQALLGGVEAFRTADLRAALLTSHMIGEAEVSWSAKTSCFHDHQQQLSYLPAGAARSEDSVTDTVVQ